MSTVFDPDDRATLKRRVERLTPTTSPRWGRMTARQMLCHTADQVRMALGDLPAQSRPTLLSRPLLREWFVLRAPWPRAMAVSPPEMQSTHPGLWADDVRSLLSLIERAGQHGEAGAWAPHPQMGALNGRDWGRLIYRHLDHHMTQFGV